MNHFFHIGINAASSTTQPERIDAVVNSAADDWMRYSQFCWIVWTSLSAQQLFDQLRPCVSLSDSILIARIDPRDRAGYLPKWAWEWLDRTRGPALASYSPSTFGSLSPSLSDLGRNFGEPTRRGILGSIEPSKDQPRGLLSGLGTPWRSPEEEKK